MDCTNKQVRLRGDLKYKDLNGDGKVTNEDKTYIGNPWPDLMYGLNINLSWKGFDLSMGWLETQVLMSLIALSFMKEVSMATIIRLIRYMRRGVRRTGNFTSSSNERGPEWKLQECLLLFCGGWFFL